MHACVEYITKFAAKCEPKSPVLKQVLNSVMHNPNTTSTPNKLIKKIMIKWLGELDFSARKTMHHLMSLKFYSCSFTVLPVSLNGSRRLRNSLVDTDSITDNFPLDVYAHRGQFCNVSQAIIDRNLWILLKTSWSNNHTIMYLKYFQCIRQILKVLIFLYIL